MAQAGFTPISLYHSSTAAAAPTAGNLANGELAINIADGKLYYKDNLGVVKSISGATATYTRTSFTATGGQTTFSVTYAVGFVQVYLNGVFLNGTDFTATNGTTVVLATGATAGDIVEVIAYNIVNIGVASSLAGGIASQIPYQSAAGVTAFIPNGTSGQVLRSNGTAVPSWGTLTVAGGGTGLTTLTANNVILGNGTSNPTFVAPSTTGNVLTSNGTTWTSAAPAGANLQEFTSSGTWTKPSSATFVMVECLAAGGGGRSGDNRTPGDGALGGSGGGGGAYAYRLFKASDLGSTESVTIGAGGAGGAAISTIGAGNAGSDGGNTSFGSFLTAYGGQGGVASASLGGYGGGVLSTGSSTTSHPYSITSSDLLTFGQFGGARPYPNGTQDSLPSGFGGGSGGSGRSDENGRNGGSSYQGGAGGGAGGSIGASQTVRVGGAGGSRTGRSAGGGAAGASSGGAGGAGTSFGFGGGGGGSAKDGSGAAGGVGGVGGLGGGGGGGGASIVTSGSSGAGAAGGGGFVRVYTW